MILSAGLTPAWQQVLVFDELKVGGVNRACEVHWCTSGKVSNAGIAAHYLGGPSLMLATVGGPQRAQMEEELDRLGVPHRFVRTESPTRVCTTLLDLASGTITELVENGQPLTTEELLEFRETYAEEVAKATVAVIIGSLPSDTPSSFYRELIERTPCPVVLDFRGEGLMSVLEMDPYVVKPNREELARSVNTTLDSDEELIQAMRLLNQRGAQWVVVTHGGDPVWVSSRTKLYRLQPPRPSTVVNPIACGDAMAAAIAWATRDGRDIVQAVRLGVGAAIENLRQVLPCRLDPDRVQQHAGEVNVEEL